MIKSNKKILNTALVCTMILCLCALFAIFFATCASASEKTLVIKPEKDMTEYTYNGQMQSYKLERSEYYTITNDQKVNAGSYEVTISLKDKQATAWDDGTTDDLIYIFTINRARYSEKYDMSGVKFDSKDVVENGEEHTLEITGELPEGITVSYSKNSYKEAGDYTVTASFSGGNENYTSIPNKIAVLSIRKASLSGKLNEDDEKDTVIISGANGINPKNNAIVITEESVEKNENVTALLAEGEKVACAYRVKLMANKITVQPDKSVEIKLLLPNGTGKDIRVLRITDDEKITEIEAESKDGYAVFETDILARFVVVEGEGQSYTWLWILLIIVAVLVVITVIVIMMVKVGNDDEDDFDVDGNRKEKKAK